VSASAFRNEWGTWVGKCPECRETIAGSQMIAEVWADYHNEDNHRPDLGPERVDM
jgi:hypothetical protein